MAKTINETYHDDYRLKQRRQGLLILISALLMLGGVAGGIFYALFFSGWMAITDVAVSQQSFVNNDEIKQQVAAYLNEKKWWIVSRANNIFLANTKSLRALLLEKFPVFKEVSIRKKYFHGLIISAMSREAVGIWCWPKQKQCFYFDRGGVIFDRANDSSGTIFLIVHDGAGEVRKMGEAVAEQTIMEWIFQLRQKLDQTKIGLAHVVLPNEQFRVNVKTTEGWEAYFSTNDALEPQIKALSFFLANKVSFEQRSQLQYIDVRIPQRVYFR